MFRRIALRQNDVDWVDNDYLFSSFNVLVWYDLWNVLTNLDWPKSSIKKRLFCHQSLCHHVITLGWPPPPPLPPSSDDIIYEQPLSVSQAKISVKFILSLLAPMPHFLPLLLSWLLSRVSWNTVRQSDQNSEIGSTNSVNSVKHCKQCKQCIARCYLNLSWYFLYEEPEK